MKQLSIGKLGRASFEMTCYKRRTLSSLKWRVTVIVSLDASHTKFTAPQTTICLWDRSACSTFCRARSTFKCSLQMRKLKSTVSVKVTLGSGATTLSFKLWVKSTTDRLSFTHTALKAWELFTSKMMAENVSRLDLVIMDKATSTQLWRAIGVQGIDLKTKNQG
jgi:hypothetical protein